MALFGKEKPVPAANGITLEEALRVITAARAKAEDIGVMMNIAVVDEGGNLTAFARMDGAWQGSIDIAQSKALTARNFDMSSEDLGKISQPGEMCYGIHVSNQGKTIIFGGGIPLQRGARIVGAIGVSGGTVPQDIEVAEAGVAAFDNTIEK
ncbi:MAG TPA: heme-binding protein [Pyrinomonadaceae bacterium]|jgi:uncharacterized protein GlcG (DUF336 family)